jgi:hypothetical protein
MGRTFGTDLCNPLFFKHLAPRRIGLDSFKRKMRANRGNHRGRAELAYP